VQLLPFQVQEVILPSTTVKVVLQWLLKENPEVPPYAGVYPVFPYTLVVYVVGGVPGT